MGLGATGMAENTDMIQIDSEAQIAYDKISVGYRAPASDKNDSLEATFAPMDGEMVEVTIRRKLDTGDLSDYVL